MSNNSGGIGIVGVLTVVFIILKLTDTIDWSWWWVLSPVWIVLILATLLIGLIALIARWLYRITRGG